MSKERLELLVQGMSCVELECCELHVSFVDSLDIRRIIALCSSVVNGVKVKEMFAESNSPSLKEIYSSCNFKVRLFYDLIGGQKGQLYSEIIQVLDIIYQMSEIYLFIVKQRCLNRKGGNLRFARRSKGAL